MELFGKNKNHSGIVFAFLDDAPHGGGSGGGNRNEGPYYCPDCKKEVPFTHKCPYATDVEEEEE